MSDFAHSSRQKPEAPLPCSILITLSYGEFDRYANSLSAAFKDLGLERGDRIILVLQNVPQFLIAAYAAWNLGAIAVPLNPMYKESELTYFCRDSGAKIFNDPRRDGDGPGSLLSEANVCPEGDYHLGPGSPSGKVWNPRKCCGG
jgi:non-ribosomal peptide synthetase component E (peptide arylation enzyme)